MRKKTILIITDGIGHSEQREFNAFRAAKKPTYDQFFKSAPYSLVDTFGLSVGLPEGQMGNSEVGHMSIGAGRVLYQDLVKISLALKDGSMARNKLLKELFGKTNTIHIVGLLSDGGVHSHIEHIKGLAWIAKEAGKKVFLHPITDGRDVSPTSALGFLKTLEEVVDDDCRIATMGGRFYSMDRDNRWEDRVKVGYDAIVLGTSKTLVKPSEYIQKQYDDGVTDEFIVPAAFDGYDGFCENDGVIFANFRSDRMREIVTAIGEPLFDKFERKFVKTNIITMTRYSDALHFPILFDKEKLDGTLCEVISKAKLRQFHTAETEKYAHVTFFLAGGVETPMENETRVLIPSPQVRTYDEKPQMSAYEVTDAVLKAMDDSYEFIVVNFANGDMVGHTGVFEAAVKAVETVDECLGKIVEKAKQQDYSMVLTADHGNCEEMRDTQGNILTNHTVGAVYCFVMDDAVKTVEKGALGNIAATVLTLMGLEVPSQMDSSLVKI